MRGGGDLVGSVTGSGDVLVEGQNVGRLDGFRFVAGASESEEEERAIHAAVRRALRTEMAARLEQLIADRDAAFGLDGEARIVWRDAAVARLRAGPHPLSPGIEPLPSELLEPAMRERMRARLDNWLAAHLKKRLGALVKARQADLAGPARGIAFQLAEGLGALPRQALHSLVDDLTQEDRKALARLGVRLGRGSVYFLPLLKPRATRTRAILWRVFHQREAPRLDFEGPVIPVAEGVPAGFYFACGYRLAGRKALRLDRVEKLLAETRKLARQGPFAITPALAALAGCRLDELPDLLVGLGYRRSEDAAGESFAPERPTRRAHGGGKARERKAGAGHRGAGQRGAGQGTGNKPAGGKKTGGKQGGKSAAANPCSPFAVLRDLVRPK